MGRDGARRAGRVTLQGTTQPLPAGVLGLAQCKSCSWSRKRGPAASPWPMQPFVRPMRGSAPPPGGRGRTRQRRSPAQSVYTRRIARSAAVPSPPSELRPSRRGTGIAAAVAAVVAPDHDECFGPLPLAAGCLRLGRRRQGNNNGLAIAGAAV